MLSSLVYWFTAVGLTLGLVITLYFRHQKRKAVEKMFQALEAMSFEHLRKTLVAMGVLYQPGGFYGDEIIINVKPLRKYLHELTILQLLGSLFHNEKKNSGLSMYSIVRAALEIGESRYPACVDWVNMTAEMVTARHKTDKGEFIKLAEEIVLPNREEIIRRGLEALKK